MHKKRNINRRIDADIFEITFDDIEALLRNQDSKCYYSEISMNYDEN